MGLSDELREFAATRNHNGTMDHLFSVRHHLNKAADELDRLTSALPKTADGVTIVPGMLLVRVIDGIVEEGVLVESVCHDGSMVVEACVEMSDAYFDADYDSGFDFYSTREAAEEAAKETTHD